MKGVIMARGVRRGRIAGVNTVSTFPPISTFTKSAMGIARIMLRRGMCLLASRDLQSGWCSIS